MELTRRPSIRQPRSRALAWRRVTVAHSSVHLRLQSPSSSGPGEPIANVISPLQVSGLFEFLLGEIFVCSGFIFCWGCDFFGCDIFDFCCVQFILAGYNRLHAGYDYSTDCNLWVRFLTSYFFYWLQSWGTIILVG